MQQNVIQLWALLLLRFERRGVDAGSSLYCLRIPIQLHRIACVPSLLHLLSTLAHTGSADFPIDQRDRRAAPDLRHFCHPVHRMVQISPEL